MKPTWLRQWNRWQFLFTQLTLISVLFLYVSVSLATSLVVSLFLAVALSSMLAQWIGVALYRLIDQARLNGDFRVMRNTVLVHTLFLIVGVLLTASAYAVALAWFGFTQYLNAGILMIGIVALDKVLSATLRAQATAIVLQAHAVRRVVLLVGLVVGLSLQAQPWNDSLLFGVLVLSPLSSVIRLMMGYVQTYKEFRFRRQFEDSGNKKSLLSLVVGLVNSYLSSLVQLALPLGLLVVLGGLTQVVSLAQLATSFTRSLLLFLAVIALARLVVATVLPETSQWKQYVQASNHSVLREQLGTISEQLLYRSLILGVVWFGGGIVLGPSVYGTTAMLLSSTAVVMATSFYLFHQRIFGLLRLSQQWLIVLGALFIFGLNTVLLLIYYPDVALMIGFVMSVVWIHASSLLVWTDSFDFELRVHLKQTTSMGGIAAASLLVNAAIYWLLSQFPLGVERFVEQLVFLGLFGIITSVVMYSLTYALGVHRSLKSRSEMLQQLSTQFMNYEEEDAIW